ncbi:MAG: hypothetical protein V1856_01345 [Candidatus Liptonbacteria bacterium]
MPIRNSGEGGRPISSQVEIGGAEVFCPTCKSRIGTTKMIHGSVAIKLNQGRIPKTTI